MAPSSQLKQGKLSPKSFLRSSRPFSIGMRWTLFIKFWAGLLLSVGESASLLLAVSLHLELSLIFLPQCICQSMYDSILWIIVRWCLFWQSCGQYRSGLWVVGRYSPPTRWLKVSQWYATAASVPILLLGITHIRIHFLLNLSRIPQIAKPCFVRSSCP